MGRCFCHGSVFICLLLPESMIICDKCLLKCAETGKIEAFKILLHFAFLLHFALYRVNAKCNKK